MMQKKMKIDWNPGTWVLIWEGVVGLNHFMPSEAREKAEIFCDIFQVEA